MSKTWKNIKNIIKSLPYALSATISLILAKIWISSMISGKTRIILDINSINEGWIESIVFLLIGIIGLYYCIKINWQSSSGLV